MLLAESGYFSKGMEPLIMTDKSIKPTRREFLRTAAIGSAAAAGSSLIPGVQAQPAAAQDVCTPNWFTKPEPITDIAETVEADIIVVGGGTSGLCAATTAAQAGAKVIVLQKGDYYSSNGWGIGGVSPAFMPEAQQNISYWPMFTQWLDEMDRKCDTEICKLWWDYSGEMLEWVTAVSGTKHGREWIVAYPAGDQAPTCLVLFQSGELATQNLYCLGGLYEECQELGVEFRFNTPGAQLVQDADGKVLGVVGHDEEYDEYVQFNGTKGVILCTGDYSHDHEMMEYYCNWMADLPSAYFPRTNTGDGHKMALWAGAVMNFPTPHAYITHYDPSVLPGPTIPFSAMPFLAVNLRGQRYANEDFGPQKYENIANQDIREPERIRWQIMDANFPNIVSGWAEGSGVIGRSVPADPLAGVEAGLEPGTVVKADTLETLAAAIGAPVETFVATVARHNELFAMGEDPDFGKDARYLYPIEQAPFYAIKRTPNVLAIPDGVLINTSLQVVKADGEPIPGLYAAGNTTGGFYGNAYGLFVPATSTGRAFTFGRLAAKSALGIPFEKHYTPAE